MLVKSHKLMVILFSLVILTSMSPFTVLAAELSNNEMTNIVEEAAVTGIVSGVVYQYSGTVQVAKSTPYFTVDLLDGDDGSRGTVSVAGAYLDGSSGSYTIKVYRTGVGRAVYTESFSADGNVHRTTDKFQLIDGGSYYITIIPNDSSKEMVVSLGIGTV